MSQYKTKYFVETQHDLDAIMDYAKQKGCMEECGEHGETHYHFNNIKSVDEIVELGVSEGLFEFYQNNGICYRLTQKGLEVFPH